MGQTSPVLECSKALRLFQLYRDVGQCINYGRRWFSARRYYRQEHPIFAIVKVGGIRRRPRLVDVATVKVVKPGSFESNGLNTWLVPYPRVFLGAEYAF